MPASQAIVTTRPTCPLCASNARKSIDALIYARHFADESDDRADIVLRETGEIVETQGRNETYEETFQELKELLSKIPGQNTKDFALVDLIIHATNGHVISEVVGGSIRSEGKYLFAGNSVREMPDLKDYLRLIVAKSMEQILSGETKVSIKQGIDAVSTLWRMSGDAGGNDLIDAMIDVVKKGEMDTNSPLGKAYAQRQAALSGTIPPEPEPTPPPEPVTDAVS